MAKQIGIMCRKHISHEDFKLWGAGRKPQKGEFIPDSKGRNGIERYLLRLGFFIGVGVLDIFFAGAEAGILVSVGLISGVGNLERYS